MKQMTRSGQITINLIHTRLISCHTLALLTLGFDIQSQRSDPDDGITIMGATLPRPVQMQLLRPDIDQNSSTMIIYLYQAGVAPLQAMLCLMLYQTYLSYMAEHLTWEKARTVSNVLYCYSSGCLVKRKQCVKMAGSREGSIGFYPPQATNGLLSSL